MEYTPSQIENAKRNYNAMLVVRTVESFNPQYIGWAAAEQRCEFANHIVTDILAGNTILANEWKLFFLTEEVKSDRKIDAAKATLTSNKNGSADLLAPIKIAKRIGEYGKWLNTSGNQYRKEHFSKNYTAASVNAFLSI